MTATIARPDPRLSASSAGEGQGLHPSGLLRGFLRGRPGDPKWVRPALLALLTFTSIIYLVDLSASGWANSFYSAAVQASTKSWEAFFFGSSDAANLISVDKPPMALWVMDISVRLFGLNSWSILVPQAVEGVACVGMLYLTVRRVSSASVGLLAGALLALTPAAAVMFRFNNPDALLVLLLTGSAYAAIRAIQSGRTSWLVLAAVFVGSGFNTKMLQAFLVVPALGTAYLFAGPPRLRRRVGQLLVAGAALAVSSAWWVATVELTPTSDRPYVGGSPNDSVLSLIFGYNGLGRLNGTETGSVGFHGSASAGGGGAQVFRMVNAQFGPYVGWLIPAAVVALVTSLILLRTRPRTDGLRAAVVLWGMWLIVTAAAFSLGQGIIHPYYGIALAPAVAALLATGLGMVWEGRRHQSYRCALAAIVVAAIGCSDLVLTETIASGVVFQVVVAAIMLIVVRGIVAWPSQRRRGRRLVVALATVASLGAPMLCLSLAVTTPEHAAIPTAAAGETTASNSLSLWLMDGKVPSPALTRLLEQGTAGYTWAAAATGSERAASYQLATGRPVMAIGGFNGTDPVPTLSEFQADVARHRVRYFVDGTPGRWLGGPDASAIARWVQSVALPHPIDGVRVYDLAAVTSR